MISMRASVFLACSFFFQFCYGQAQPHADAIRTERANEAALERYAKQVGEDAPKIEDYVYGMKLDIAKIIHISPPVKHCGIINSYMSYQDSKGKLHSIRYIEQGECPQKR